MGDLDSNEETQPLVAKVEQPKPKLSWVLPGLLIGVFLSAADNTLVITSAAAIGNEFGQLKQVSWVGTAYMISLTITQPCYGRLSLIFGVKRTFVASYLLFAFGALLCGLARTMNELIAARALAGIGGGGVTTLTTIIVSDLVSLRARGTYQGLLNVVFSIGASTGSTLGGFFADSSGWRSSFLCQPPVLLVAAVWGWFSLQHMPVHKSGESVKERILKIDFLGICSLGIATTALLISLDIGSNGGWAAPAVIALFVVAAAFYVAFIYLEFNVVKLPIAPKSVLLARTPCFAFFANFFAFMGQFSLLFWVPLYFQIVDGASATRAGLYIIIAVVGSSIGSLLGGIIMHQTGRYYILTLVAYTTSTISLSLIAATWHRGMLRWIELTPLATHGLGAGIGVTTLLLSIIASTSKEDQSIGISMSYLFRSLGTVIGVAVSSAIVQGSLRGYLSRSLNGSDATEIARKARETLTFLDTLPLDTRNLVIQGYEQALRYAFTFGATCMGMALLCSLLLKEHSLNR